MKRRAAAVTAMFLHSVAAAAQPPLPPAQTGLLYLSGWGNNVVGELHPDGTVIRTITATGMVKPRGIATEPDGTLVVVCEGNAATSSRILRIGLDGTLLQTITSTWLTSGTGIARAPDGRWFVGNYSPGRIVIFDAAWNFYAIVSGPYLVGVNCVAFDASGAYAATSASLNQVQTFDAQNVPLATITHQTFGSVMSIAVDSQGSHYVSNGSNSYVTKFDAAWNPVTAFGAAVLAGPQGIAIDEYDRLTVTNFYTATVHRWSPQGTLLGQFPLNFVTTARNLTWQTSPLALARGGTVNLGAGTLARPLALNGSTGTALGDVSLPSTAPLNLALAAPAAGPNPAAFVLYFVAGDPGLAGVAALPGGLGFASFATPLSGGAPATLRNSIGFEGLLGTGILPPVAAPATVLSLPGGSGFLGTVTLQGIILDNGARTAPALPASLTNTLVVTFI